VDKSREHAIGWKFSNPLKMLAFWRSEVHAREIDFEPLQIHTRIWLGLPSSKKKALGRRPLLG
jgi:hypothetical protein